MSGARGGYALPLMLERAGRLGTFYTDFYTGNKPWLRELANFASATVGRSLGSRDCPELDPRRVCSFDLLGIAAAVMARRVRSRAGKITHYLRTNRAFGLRVASRMDPEAGAIYGFNGAAKEIFERGRMLHHTCVLEQSSSAGRIEAELLDEESRRWPGWEARSPADEGVMEKFHAREASEWALADRIICGSRFVADGLARLGIERQKLCVVPYGVNVGRLSPAREARPEGPIRILFVGNLGLQKGLPYLWQALKRLGGGFECRAVGPRSILPTRLAEIAPLIRSSGPLPRAEVEHAYRWADVFVLPSICEGSALAVYEAMAHALPVIVTPNTGSVARDGLDGYVVPIRDPDALAERLEHLACERDLIHAMGRSARHFIENFSLEHYGAALLRAIDAAVAVSQARWQAAARSQGRGLEGWR